MIRADATDAAEYRAAGWWGDDTIGSLVSRWAEERPEAAAFISGDTRFTWAQYDATADAIARAPCPPVTTPTGSGWPC